MSILSKKAVVEHDQAEMDRRTTTAQWWAGHEALEIFLRKDARAWMPDEARKVKATMSTSTPSQGGYTVAPLVAADFCDTLKGYGWMRQVASQFTTLNGADLSYPTSDGSGESGEILAQNAAVALLDPSFGAAALNTAKFSSKVFTVPIELIQDSMIDIVSMVFSRARDRIGRTMNAKFTTGSGTGEPTGLVTAASVGKTGTTGQTTTIIFTDLVDMIDSVDESHLGMPDKSAPASDAGPGWMFSQTMRRVVRSVKDTNNRPIWLPAYEEGAKALAPAQLLGYPVYINNDMAVPAANAKSLAFGNLKRYMIRDAADVMLLRFDDSAFALKGQVGFLAVARAGGNLLDTGAVKLYQHSAT
jgi:HK97 family phage major capsid protein